MDKAEYKIKLEQINSLAEAGNFREAAKIADEIDWRHVKSVRTLSMIGEIYEADKQYDESLRILKYAYRRSVSSKTVLYRLAELDIRTGHYDEAKKFINEFEQNSPNDTSRYILRYKLLRAEKAPLDDQIAVLRAYRDTEYTERWAYELAKLYKKNGQNEKCVEECDDMILWFSEGRYVQKAMELKMSITDLTPSQQAMYEANRRKIEEEEAAAAEKAALEAKERAEEQARAEAAARAEAEAKAAAEAEAEAEREAKEAAEAESGAPEDESSESGAEEPQDGESGAVYESGAEDREESEESGESEDEDEDEDEDDESRPRVSTQEAISKMETAAGISIGDVGGSERAAEDAGAAKKPAQESIQKRIASGLRAVFSGRRKSAESAAGAEARTVSDEEEETFETIAAAADRISGDGEPGPAETAADAQEKSAGAAGGQSVMNSETIDLAELFAETGNAFATEVASGNYVMADTLESDRQEAEAEIERRRVEKEEEIPEEIAIPGADEIRNAVPETDREVPAEAGAEEVPAENEAPAPEAAEQEAAEGGEESREDVENSLFARETDESLGLTREFHIGDELDRALAERAAKAAGESGPKINVTPEQAARKTVIEANGGVYDPEAPEVPVTGDGKVTVDEAEAAELLESEAAEIPAEEPPEVLMNLSETEAPETHGEGAGIIDQIMSAPDYLVPVPVEGRALTDAEKKALSFFAEIPGIDYQVTSAIADIHNNCGDRTSRSGNVLIMGRMGSGKTRIAEGLIRAVCMHLGIKAAREARIVAEDFNGKDPAGIVKKLAGGFLIIEAAGALSDDTVARLNQAMEFRTDDLIVILEDEKADLTKMLGRHPGFAAKFTSTITVPVLTNDELVAFGKLYADESGYKLDEMATLALYTMIGDNQKDAEPVTVGMVRDMVGKAIDRNSRKFRFGKVDREDGRTVLHEKDFSF